MRDEERADRSAGQRRREERGETDRRVPGALGVPPPIPSRSQPPPSPGRTSAPTSSEYDTNTGPVAKAGGGGSAAGKAGGGGDEAKAGGGDPYGSPLPYWPAA